jgi:hypothetical protein
MDQKDGNEFQTGLLPGDAVAWAHAHYLLDLLFGIFGKLCNFDAPCLTVPFENVGTETDTRFAVGTFRPINDRTFFQWLSRSRGCRSSDCGSLVGFPDPLAFPREILPISEARTQFTGRSFAALSSAQAAPGLAAQLALFAIGAFFFFWRLGHVVPPPLTPPASGRGV